MLQFQLMTEKDRKEAAAIEKRRIAEEERKKRIFNPRWRKFGIDHETLDKQIEEKRQRDEEEKKRDLIFEEQIKKNGQIALAYEQKEKEERKKIQKEIDEFRRTFQRFEDRREFDLNDPNRIKKILPARIRDDDPRLGLSSVQKFEGEDLIADERLRVQREQVRSWLDQQMQEKEAAEKDRIAAEEAYRAALVARDMRAIELDRLEKECRKKMELACIRFNRALADERECERLKKERQEKEDNLAEIYNMMMSDMLTENPEVSQSTMGPNKPIGYLYKGMTPEEKEVFRALQQAQIEEAKKRRENEKRIDREMDEFMNGIQRTVNTLDKEIAQKEKEKVKQIAKDNLKMSEEHKKHIEYLNKVVYRNRATDEYFDQFNRGTR